jgi:hypothetical protein
VNHEVATHNISLASARPVVHQLDLCGFSGGGYFAIGGQSIPIFLEYQAIRKAALKASKDGSTVAEIQAAFDRAGAIDNISSISGKDLEITKRGDKTIVSLKYSREIELAGPAFLVYRFQYQTN